MRIEKSLFQDETTWLLALVALLLLFALIIIEAPIWQVDRAVDSGGATPAQRPELIDTYRNTILRGVGGLVVLVGLGLTWRRIRVTEDGQITERFTRATEQLGSKSIEVRLGGIYALERIARDSRKDHWTIIEVLAAFVRENGSPDDAPEGEGSDKPSTDVQAALTVIGRRNTSWDPDGHFVNLFGARIEGADLSEAHLESANLVGVHLEHAKIQVAHLESADLPGAHLEGADLWGAHLEDADLSEAHGLTLSQLRFAFTSEGTLIDEPLNSALVSAKRAAPPDEPSAGSELGRG